jgi:acetyl esterase/lipase
MAADCFPLWPQGAPGALGQDPERDIPTLTIFEPEGEPSRASVIICPGGGYEMLAPYEGATYAHWLNELGLTCFVLKYRLGSHGYRHPCMMQDAARAIRLVRAGAARRGLDSAQIGLMGSSAGGHLASTILTHFDGGQPEAEDEIERVSSRPDFGILCYPVIAMTGPNTHEGSRANLLGNDFDPQLAEFLSSEKQVTAETPPSFTWFTQNDEKVKVENGLEWAAALRKNEVPFALHLYSHGRHGLGLGVQEYQSGAQLLPWTDELKLWLQERQLIR